MIFQHFNLISGSTIAENVAFSLYANNIPSQRIRSKMSERTLRDRTSSEKADAYSANLSEDETASCIALANNPDIVAVLKQPPHWILRIQKKS